MQIKHLSNLRYTVAQTTAIYIIVVQTYILIIIFDVSKTILTYEYDCSLDTKKNENVLNQHCHPLYENPRDKPIIK